MQTIYLDISSKNVVPCIQAKQSEVGRKFLAVITDNGVPYNIPNDALLSVWYEGDTDAGNYSSIAEKSAFNIHGNKVTVELVAQMLLRPGKGEMCLSITRGDGGETNTWNIPYSVEYKPGAGSSVPTEYYTALTEAASEAARHVTDAAQYADEAKTAVAGYVKADGSTQMTGDLNMAGFAIKNIEDANNDGDAVPFRMLKDFVNNLKKEIFSTIYDVGDFVINETGVNPSVKFGGTWELVTDRFLLGAGNKYDAKSTGGRDSAEILLENIPEHYHKYLDYWSSKAAEGEINKSVAVNGDGEGIDETIENDRSRTASAGGGKPLDIMNPYYAVYIWRRIA